VRAGETAHFLIGPERGDGGASTVTAALVLTVATGTQGTRQAWPTRDWQDADHLPSDSG
jgi:hypothetical protein